MALYKETMERKKGSVVFNSFMTLISFIVVYDFVIYFTSHNSLNTIIKYTFYFLFVAMFFLHLNRLRTKYKYSVIGDELIIHKIRGKEQVLLEDVTFKDIQSINRCDGINKLNIYHFKKYTFFFNKKNRYCCRYCIEGKVKKFYFQPSECLLKKIKYTQNNMEKIA